MVTELMKDVYWVGIVDWGLRKFHGHELSTHRGSTYNSYLIRDEKTVLIDTTWAPFKAGVAREHQGRHRPGEDRHRRCQPRRARSLGRASPHHAACAQRRADRVQAGHGEHRGALPPALEIPGRQDGRPHPHREKRARLHRGDDAPLARQHVHLPGGQKPAHAQ